MRTRRALVLVAALAGILLVAAPAQAYLIETPLRLHTETGNAEVGDDVAFTIRPHNESARAAHGGSTVSARFLYDPHERDESTDAPAGGRFIEREIMAALPLDDEAKGTFTWTVPDEVDGFNVEILLQGEDGERLAFAYLPVGDAIPRMYLINGPADGAPEDQDGAEKAPAEASPGAGVLLVVAILAALAVVRSRRV